MSPVRYPFTEIHTGIFFFPTDKGTYYTIEVSNTSVRFSDNEILYNDGKIFEISFEKKGNEKGFDISTSETIIFIITNNFLSKGSESIFYFVCDTSERRGKSRARLFNLWFLKILKLIPLMVKVDFRIPGYNNEEFDISIFIHKNHPRFNEYIDQFGKSLDENFNKLNLT